MSNKRNLLNFNSKQTRLKIYTKVLQLYLLKFSNKFSHKLINLLWILLIWIWTNQYRSKEQIRTSQRGHSLTITLTNYPIGKIRNNFLIWSYRGKGQQAYPNSKQINQSNFSKKDKLLKDLLYHLNILTFSPLLNPRRVLRKEVLLVILDS